MSQNQCQTSNNHPIVRLCGLPKCDRLGTSVDSQYGYLCAAHNGRVRRAVKMGMSPEEAYSFATATPIISNVPVTPIADFNIQKVKERICSTQLDFIRPLLLFKGSMTEGRMASFYNLLAAAKDSNVLDISSIMKASMHLTDPVHYCGFHKIIQRLTFTGLCSRILQTPSVLTAEKDWRDYIETLRSVNRHDVFCSLVPISPTAYRVRSSRDWRLIARPKRAPIERVTEYYPYIKGEVTDDHALLLAVDKLVPKGLNDDTRADVCQDMIVAILTGEVSIDNLAAERPKYMKKFFKMFPTKYGHISLDAPLMYGGDEMNKTVADTIAAEYR